MKRSSYTIGDFVYGYTLDKKPPEALDNRHCHDTYEILYVLDGVGRFIVEGTVYNITPGTLMVIRPFEYHSIELDSDHQYERYVLNFSPSCLVDDALKLLQGFMSAEEGSGKLYSAGELSQNILPLFDRFEIA